MENELEYVSEEQALRLSKIDFKLEINSKWCFLSKTISDSALIGIPLKQQVFRWFREKHQLYSQVLIDCTTYPKFCYQINKFYGNPRDLTIEEWGWEMGNYSILCRTYEEAENECINQLISLIEAKI